MAPPNKESTIANVKVKKELLTIQFNSIQKLLNVEAPNQRNLALRLEKLKAMFDSYEQGIEEVMLLDPDNALVVEYESLQERYYQLAAENEPPINNSNISQPLIADKSKDIQLPQIKIPYFDGNSNEWITFKNTFETFVHDTNMTPLQKFSHLRTYLKGEALEKIKFFSLSDDNYERAWKLLNESYNRKRLLAVRYFDAILDLARVKKDDAAELSKLVDDMRQHCSMLESLDIIVDENIVLRILERSLPVNTRKEWEGTLGLDKLPELKEFYKFTQNYIFKLRTLDAERSIDNRKRFSGDPSNQTNKFKKSNNGARSLALSHNNFSCWKCKEKHRLIECPEFRKLEVSARWAFVKTQQLCRNCLHKHKDQCRSEVRCKFCKGFHNSLLHVQKKGVDSKVKGEGEKSADNSIGKGKTEVARS